MKKVVIFSDKEEHIFLVVIRHINLIVIHLTVPFSWISIDSLLSSSYLNHIFKNQELISNNILSNLYKVAYTLSSPITTHQITLNMLLFDKKQ